MPTLMLLASTLLARRETKKHENQLLYIQECIRGVDQWLNWELGDRSATLLPPLGDVGRQRTSRLCMQYGRERKLKKRGL